MDCSLDFRIRPAATEIAGHRMLDLLCARLRIRREQRGGGDDLPRRAETALGRVGLDESLDERVLPQPLDGSHLAFADRVDKRDAGEHRHPVELHRAGAAVTLAAGDLRAGQAEVEPERLGQRAPHGRFELIGVAVDRELNQTYAPSFAVVAFVLATRLLRVCVLCTGSAVSGVTARMSARWISRNVVRVMIRLSGSSSTSGSNRQTSRPALRSSLTRPPSSTSPARS